jgi:hypothetical protein
MSFMNFLSITGLLKVYINYCGILNDCYSNEEYHADPAISASQLKEICKSPFHYWKRNVDPD